MANRKDFHYRQLVTESELDSAFNDLEIADRAIVIDHDLTGIVSGLGLSEKSGTPDLSVDVQGPGVAYSKDGERISIASTQNVDVSVDDSAVTTSVAVAGNAKVVSVFIVFDRVLSDPRTDGLGATVYFQRNETYEFSVIQGSEAVSGLEVPPSISPDKILLGDITLIFGQTQVVNADIDFSRSEYCIAHRSGNIKIVEGTPNEAIGSLLDEVNDHIDGVANFHLASAINYGGGINWKDGQTNPATTVEAQLDKILTDLVSNDGTDKIGGLGRTVGSITVTSVSLEAQITELMTYLNEALGASNVSKYLHSSNYRDSSSVTSATSYDIKGIDICKILKVPRFICVAYDSGGTPTSEARKSNSLFGPWSDAGAFVDMNMVNDIAYSPDLNLWCAVGLSTTSSLPGIETRPGATDTWTKRTPVSTTPSEDFDVVIYDPVASTFIAVGMNGLSEYSYDGINWNSATTKISSTSFDNVLDIATRLSGNPATVAVGEDSTLGGRIFLTLDGGNNWSDVTPVALSGSVLSVAYDSFNDCFIAVGVSGVFVSDSMGDNWTDLTPTIILSGTSLSHIAVSEDGTAIALDYEGMIAYITFDAGTSWHGVTLDNENGTIAGSYHSFKFLGGRFVSFHNDVFSISMNGSRMFAAS